jgi:ankyrin repeat protein
MHFDMQYGRTPLHVAAFNNCVAATKVLLDHGASTTAQDQVGDQPMSITNTYLTCRAEVTLRATEYSQQLLHWT